jgi:hypothetical protein
MCLISSQASLQAGQVPEFLMCLLARTPLHGNKPCRTRHPNFFYLGWDIKLPQIFPHLLITNYTCLFIHSIFLKFM